MATNFTPEDQPRLTPTEGGIPSSKPKTTAEVIALAKSYVEKNYLGQPGFVGAHLVGSIIHADRDAIFPTYCDVDIAIVLDSIDYQKIEEVFQEGYVLECILSGSSRYRSAEDILALPGMACNLQKNSILVDPEGRLAKIHREVAEGFAMRHWVKRRVNTEMNVTKSALEAMSRSRNVIEAVHALCEFVMHCSASITTAHLKPPTHRRSLANLNALMNTPEERSLFEDILKAFGSAQLSEPEVRTFLQQCLEAFDRAIVVKRSPVPFEWKLDPCIRDYLNQGTLEILAEGLHREAIFWIAIFFIISTIAIQQDGLAEEKEHYATRLTEFLRALGLDSTEAIKLRIEFCTVVYENVAAYLEDFVATSSQLK